MSASSVASPAPVDVSRDQRIPFSVVRDTAAIAKRNLIAYRRVPQLLVFSTIQPVIFVLMFRYVFGGAVGESLPPGVTYVDYLMPGIFVQTVTFGAIATAIGLASDVKSGLMERFHALPMARSAVLTGRTTADATRNVFVVILMMVVGFLVGWRIHTGVLPTIAAGMLVVLFGFSMSWIFATVGLAVGDPETAQAAAFPVLGAADLRVHGVRARGHDAGVAAGLRQPSTGVGHRQRGASAHAGRRDGDLRLAGPGVGRGALGGVRIHRGAALPEGRVSGGGRRSGASPSEGPSGLAAMAGAPPRACRRPVAGDPQEGQSFRDAVV